LGHADFSQYYPLLPPQQKPGGLAASAFTLAATALKSLKGDFQMIEAKELIVHLRGLTEYDYEGAFSIDTGLAAPLSDLASAVHRIASVMERLPNLLPEEDPSLGAVETL
jgi:enoyl reductase-like protein